MFRKILVANDRAPGAFKVLAASFDVAQRCHSELHIVVVESPLSLGTIDEVEPEFELADRQFCHNRRLARICMERAASACSLPTLRIFGTLPQDRW
jgi:hypothetical protein